MAVAQRLHSAVSAVCPIIGVSVVDAAAHSANIVFDPSATTAQQNAANAVLAAFDWSAVADATFNAQQQSAAASTSVDNGLLQAGVQLDRLIVALALVVLDEVNVLRTALALAPRTQTQLVNAVKAKIATLPT